MTIEFCERMSMTRLPNLFHHWHDDCADKMENQTRNGGILSFTCGSQVESIILVSLVLVAAFSNTPYAQQVTHPAHCADDTTYTQQ